jgi:penicillin-binding protein 2
MSAGLHRTGRLTTPRAQRVRRSRGARVVVGLVAAFLGVALFNLQVVRGDDYARVSRNNRLRELPVPAPRGTIFDRHGRVVAGNVPGYRIQIMPGNPKYPKAQYDSLMAQVGRLRTLIGLTDAQVAYAFNRWSRQKHLPLVVLDDAPLTDVAAIEERRAQFPDVIVHEYAKRQYPAGEAIAHFIGYVNEINERQLKSKEFEGYEQGRWIGQAGLERQYEKWLGGTPGKQYLEIDSRGRIRGWAESMTQPAIPGKDLHLYLDLDLQEYIANIFPKDYDGAIVALDPQTGGILAYYSNPTYDPNIWIGGISTADFDRLNTDPRKPLLDRVVASGQPAASTWKLAMAGMALDLGVLDPEAYMPIPCSGGLSFQGRYAKCHGVHGRNNLIDGIKNSCNVYFYQVGIRIGLARLLEHGAKLGFGKRTGIDVPHEIKPNWPDIDWWPRTQGYRAAENEVMSLAIGQGPLTMTIIKLAHIYASLTAPTGKVPAPRLAMESNTPQDTVEFHTTPRDRWYLEAGMRRVVAPGGTAQLSRLPWWDFIGKTGTAQAPDHMKGGKDHGWFVGTGAREVGQPPEIAVTMFLARSEHGYISSGYVAEVINFYLSRKYGRPFVKYATPRWRTQILGVEPIDPNFLSKPIVDPPMPAAIGADSLAARKPTPAAAPQPLGTPVGRQR